jgi:hypothetical protein
VSAATALARGRTAAEALMVDACTITRRTGQTTDDLTGAVTPATTTVYTGPCKVQTSGSGAMGRRYDVAETTVVMLRLELHLPMATSAAVARGDLVTVTASATDPGLVGRTWHIHDLSHKSWATARRFLIEEAT